MGRTREQRRNLKKTARKHIYNEKETPEISERRNENNQTKKQGKLQVSYLMRFGNR